MNAFKVASFALLVCAVIGTIFWSVFLTRKIKTAPDLPTRSGVRGTALTVRESMPSLMVLFLACVSFTSFAHIYTAYTVYGMALILMAFYRVFFIATREQVACEISRFSTGRSTWRGKRALRWVRESAIAVGLSYVLFLSLFVLSS